MDASGVLVMFFSSLGAGYMDVLSLYCLMNLHTLDVHIF